MFDLVKLKSVCDIQSGGTPSRKKNSHYGGKIKWAKISDLETAGDGFIYNTEEHITESGLENIRNRMFEIDTLFLAMYGSVGKTAITKERMSCNQAILGINVNKQNLVHLPFLKYWFDSVKEKLINSARGVALKNLSAGIVKDLKIPLPPLAIQQKIAQILDDAVDLRDKTKQLLQEYDALAQSIFLDMFGDPLRNPKGWNITRFDELVSVDCPLTYGIVQPGEEFVNGVPCVRPVDLINQYIGLNNLKMIDPVISNKFKRTLLNGGEILLSVRGSVGVISIADESLKGANVTRGIVPIWFNKSISNKLFFYYLYKTKRVQNQIKRLSKGATLIQINLKDLRELKLIQPPIGIQNQFAEKIALLEKQKELAKQELQESEDLFNCLLQKAFKGELVKE